MRIELAEGYSHVTEKVVLSKDLVEVKKGDTEFSALNIFAFESQI